MPVSRPASPSSPSPATTSPTPAAPLRVVQAYCLGLLTCDGFLAFERGDPNDCAAIPTAIADCEAEVRSAASAARHPSSRVAADEPGTE